MEERWVCKANCPELDLNGNPHCVLYEGSELNEYECPAGNTPRWELETIMKCHFPEGITIRPNGVDPLDPCIYDVVETHYDCMVNVLRCRKCGHTEIEWSERSK